MVFSYLCPRSSWDPEGLPPEPCRCRGLVTLFFLLSPLCKVYRHQ
jgi:hypothetical protein